MIQLGSVCGSQKSSGRQIKVVGVYIGKIYFWGIFQGNSQCGHLRFFGQKSENDLILCGLTSGTQKKYFKIFLHDQCPVGVKKRSKL
jgi:hypothetical protein